MPKSYAFWRSEWTINSPSPSSRDSFTDGGTRLAAAAEELKRMFSNSGV
jgi:hypothetical protein